MFQFEALRENQKLGSVFENVGRVFENSAECLKSSAACFCYNTAYAVPISHSTENYLWSS